MARTLREHVAARVPCSENAARQHGHRDMPTELHATAGVTAARRLNRAAGMIAASVLIDSAMEHYRGNFHNKAMWTPTRHVVTVDRGEHSRPVGQATWRPSGA